MKKITNMDGKDAAKLFSEQGSADRVSTAASHNATNSLDALKKLTSSGGSLPTAYTEGLAPEEKPSDGPVSVRDRLEQLKKEQIAETAVAKELKLERDPNANANAVAAAMYQRGRATSNVESSSEVQTVQHLSATERSAADAESAAVIEKFAAGRHNKDFLTEVKGASHVRTKNLSDEKIEGMTAGLRNVGFITDVQPGEVKHQDSLSEQITELETLDRIVGTRTNTRLTEGAEEEEGKNE